MEEVCVGIAQFQWPNTQCNPVLQCFVPRLPVDSEFIQFHDWAIKYEKLHILKSSCQLGTAKCCPKDSADRCDLCHYQHSLQLPHLPDMVFHKNRLVLQHKDGATLEFCPMDALALVDNGKQPLEVACAQEWRETRWVLPLRLGYGSFYCCSSINRPND